MAALRWGSPKLQVYTEVPERFTEVAGLRRGSKVFRQNRAGRGALEDTIAGVGLHGWPISACRAGQCAPQAPRTRVSLHGFGGRRACAQRPRGAGDVPTPGHGKGEGPGGCKLFGGGSSLPEPNDAADAGRGRSERNGAPQIAICGVFDGAPQACGVSSERSSPAPLARAPLEPAEQRQSSPSDAKARRSGGRYFREWP